MTIAPPDTQMMLLDTAPSYTITKNAQARNAYGTVAGEIVQAALKLQPIRINCNYTCCFDAYCNRTSTYYEIKSVKHTGKVVIYDWRAQKEQDSGVPLHYAILCHNVSRSNGRMLAVEMVQSNLKLIVLPAHLVHEAAKQQPLRILQKPQPKRTGYNRKGYVLGYRNVPLVMLRELASHLTTLPCTYAGLQFNIQLCQLPPTP